MNNSDYINESVLLNYFTGELSPKHRKKVEKWIHLSEDNEKIARNIFQLYHSTNILISIFQINMTKFSNYKFYLHSVNQASQGP